MRKIKIRSYPKINLALDILGKDPSGYHIIQTVFHELKKPFDELIIEEADAITVTCDNPRVPTDETNTVLKAALLLKENMCIKARVGAKIFIKKKIPLMSGLGGGASNAVAALKSLAKLWGIQCCSTFETFSVIARPGGPKQSDTKCHPEHIRFAQCKLREGSSRLLRFARNDRVHTSFCLLRRLANQIGMDCAFFFHGGTALGTHFGEKITLLPQLPKEIKFEIIDTSVEISSHDAYQQTDLKKCGRNTDKTARLIEAIKNQDSRGILDNLHNDFEEFVFKRHPKLYVTLNLSKGDGPPAMLRRALHNNQSSRVLLCGSGGALVKCYAVVSS